MPLPALRNLDIVPVNQDGQMVVCLHDPEGYVEEQAMLSPPAFFVASCLDGTTDVVDVQHAFAQHFGGTLIMSDDVLKVVSFLDDHGFLVSGKFTAIRRQVVDAFAALDVRPAHLAGKSYPEDPAELRTFLDGLFTAEGAPGRTPDPIGNGPPLRCLIVPHIDFQRGGPTYAHGYSRMATHGRPDTVFVFGVSHVGGDTPFILTRKAYETPLGAVPTDTEIVDKLAAACAWDPFADEVAHRTEHSIEFQALMLAYLYGPTVRMVPILCAALMPEPDVSSPSEIEAVAKFLAACHALAAPEAGNTCVVAGADLAHVGRRFGDSFEITPAILRRVGRRDEEDLAFARMVDPEGFYRSVMKDGNERRVCGLGCIYAALKTVGGSAAPGELLHYHAAPDPAGGVVSFAGMAFARK